MTGFYNSVRKSLSRFTQTNIKQWLLVPLLVLAPSSPFVFAEEGRTAEEKTEIQSLRCLAAMGAELSEEATQILDSSTPDWRTGRPRDNGMNARPEYGGSRYYQTDSSSSGSSSSSYGSEGAGGAWSSDF